MGIRGYPNILIFGLGFMTSEISMYGHKRFFLFLGMTIYGLFILFYPLLIIICIHIHTIYVMPIHGDGHKKTYVN